jgi:hypothetical protein
MTRNREEYFWRERFEVDQSGELWKKQVGDRVSERRRTLAAVIHQARVCVAEPHDRYDGQKWLFVALRGRILNDMPNVDRAIEIHPEKRN